MTTATLLKTIAIGGIVIYLLVKFLMNRIGFKNAKPKVFYSINHGNQNKLIYAPKYRKEWFDELDKKYSWENFDEYDNRFWEYMYELFDTLPKIARKTEPDQAFFNNLTRGQKVFYCFLTFGGDVDNGGVWQFFYNRPEFSIATLEAFEELKLTKLKTDYEKCVDEFLGITGSYSKRKEISGFAKNRWITFKGGYNLIKSAKTIEDYYYDKEFKKELFKALVQYVDNNLDQFVKK